MMPQVLRPTLGGDTHPTRAVPVASPVLLVPFILVFKSSMEYHNKSGRKLRCCHNVMIKQCEGRCEALKEKRLPAKRNQRLTYLADMHQFQDFSTERLILEYRS